VPSQPSNFRTTDIGETAVTLQWSKPTHSGENIVHYELYWNDTYANEQHHQYVKNLFLFQKKKKKAPIKSEILDFPLHKLFCYTH
jgi:hypothetical protein